MPAKELPVKTRRVRRATLSVALICISLLGLLVPFPSSAELVSRPYSGPPVASPVVPSYPQHIPINGPPESVTRLPSPPTTQATYDARLLVIAADGTEADLAAIRQSLDFLGTPYTVYTATLHPNGLTSDLLFAVTNGFYQGVILTTGNLSYFDGTAYRSALNTTEWQTLWDYEAAFGVRQVTWYTFPTTDYGFSNSPTGISTTPPNPPVTATLTTVGQTIFSYVNAANPVAINYAFTYLASPAITGTTPLLTNSNGNALALVKAYPDGRENLALTFDSSSSLIHTLQLGYGVVNWVTRGLFLGERHVYMGAQVDDIFIADRIWPPGTPCDTDPSSTTVFYRIKGADFQLVRSWQQDKQTQPSTTGLRLSMAFNGLGATTAYTTDTTLRTSVLQYQHDFDWINHTYHHISWEDMNYNDARSEVTSNRAVAYQMQLSNFSYINLVTPEHSGLTNPNAMQAAADTGVRYVVSDSSRPGQNNPSPNAGNYNVLQPSILMIPRHPTNLFYNVSKPSEWAAEYNCRYHTYWGRDLAYTEILGKESDVLLRYMLKGEIDPWMFHQTNLRTYDGRHFTLADLLDATLSKYNALFNLPVVSLTMNKLGSNMTNRMGYNATGAIANIVPGQTITIHSDQDAIIPITGARADSEGSTTEVYGGQQISLVKLQANQSITISLQGIRAGRGARDFASLHCAPTGCS